MASGNETAVAAAGAQAVHTQQQLTTAVAHLLEAVGNILFGFLENLDKVARLRGILRCEERVAGTGTPGACSAANTVHIVFYIVREVVIDHKFDVFHVCCWHTTRHS